MRHVKVQQLSYKTFKRYGSYLNLTDDDALAEKSVFSAGLFADVIKLEFGGTLEPTVSVNSLRHGDPIVKFIEYHRNTCEGILPLDTDVILFVGLPVRGKLSSERIEAFYVPQNTFVCLDPLIIHGNLFCLEETGHSLCMLPGRTFANDMEMKVLSNEEALMLAL